MPRFLTRSIYCGALLGTLSTMPGCGGVGQLLPVDAGRGFSGQLTEWSESWEAAPLGPKAEFEVFEADSGSWETRLDPPEGLKQSDGHSTGAEVRIVEGNGMVLYSRSFGIATVEQEINPQDNITSETPLPLTHGVVFARDTIFSSIFNCEMHSLHDLATDEWLTAGIELNVWGWRIRYWHEDSSPWDLADGVFIPDDFTRNVYDDLVRVYGRTGAKGPGRGR